MIVTDLKGMKRIVDLAGVPDLRDNSNDFSAVNGLSILTSGWTFLSLTEWLFDTPSLILIHLPWLKVGFDHKEVSCAYIFDEGQVS